MDFPDFDDYEIENTELCDVQVKKESVTLTFHCPIVGADWKSMFNSLRNLFKRNAKFTQDFDVELQITFTGVEWIGSAGERFSDETKVRALFDKGAPLLVSAFYFKKTPTTNHACFVFDSGTIDIVYYMCAQTQVTKDES